MNFNPKYFHRSYKAKDNAKSINAAVNLANKNYPQLSGCTQSIVVGGLPIMDRVAYYDQATGQDVWGKWIFRD